MSVERRRFEFPERLWVGDEKWTRDTYPADYRSPEGDCNGLVELILEYADELKEPVYLDPPPPAEPPALPEGPGWLAR